MTTNENDLVINNMKLAYKIAYKYYQKFNSLMELEDIQSLCFIGLVKAAQTFKEDKKIAFSTYAYKVMQNEILIYYELRLKNSIKPISLSLEIEENKTLEDTLSSIEDLEENIEKKLLIDKLYKFIRELEEIEQKIVLGHLQNKTIKQLEQITGLKHDRLNVIYRKAINKLKIKFYKDRSFEDE